MILSTFFQLLLHLDELRNAFVHLLDRLELRDPHPLPVADIILATHSLAVLTG